MNKFTKKDIDSFLTKQPLWTKFVLQPLFKPLIVLIVNKVPWLHPNFITIFSLFFSFLEVYFFAFVYGYIGVLLGAVFFELSYFLDCIDGPVARILNKNSKLGTALDISADSLRLGGGTLALVFRTLQNSNNERTILFWGIVLITSHMASMWVGYKQLFDNLRPSQKIPTNTKEKQKSFFLFIPFLWIADFFVKLSKDDRNYWLFPTSVELETVVYFLLPLMDKLELAVIVGGIWSIANLIAIIIGYVK